jgi:hypothetical protein
MHMPVGIFMFVTPMLFAVFLVLLTLKLLRRSCHAGDVPGRLAQLVISSRIGEEIEELSDLPAQFCRLELKELHNVEHLAEALEVL